MDRFGRNIWDVHQSLKKGDFSSRELTEALLAKIAKFNPDLNTFITVCEEEALLQAAEADRKIQSGSDLSPLCGIPLSLKDIFLTRGIKTTCGSRILENFIPPYTATSAQHLLDRGAVILGKVNMDQFAMGSSTETSFMGASRNPWNRNCTTGGSSGGSAASVAAGFSFGSLGTDTGGSIRQPSAHCGVTGLKPTYGRVSRYGVIAFASSLDQVGPMGKDVRDCALLLQAIAGHDPLDSTSVDLPVPDYTSFLDADLKGLCLGIPQEYWPDRSKGESGLDPEAESILKEALQILEKQGVRLKKVSLPHTRYAVATYYVIAPAEASSNLARYDGIRYGYRHQEAGDLMEMYCRSRADGFGDEVKRRIMMGTYVLSAGYYDAYYRKAQQVRTLIRNDFEAALSECDALITPVTPTAAFRLGEKMADPLAMYLEDIFTISCNLAGLPGMSVPCGFTSEGLPLGLQILGRSFDEGMLLRIGSAYQRETEWHMKEPELG